MASVVGFVQRGDTRVVLLRGRLPTAAIVPMADFWFLFQIEEELRRLGWFARRRAPQPEAIARAIVALQPLDKPSNVHPAVPRPRVQEAPPWVMFDRKETLARRLRGWRSAAERSW
jgi:hypothetical protein